MERFTTIMVNREIKAKLDEVKKRLKYNFPFIDSYSDLIKYLIWFWETHYEGEVLWGYNVSKHEERK